MTENHPITPPPELVQQWVDEYLENNPACAAPEFIATRAAQWGANQELEACCEWFQSFYKLESWMLRDLERLRAARRPKPPSLKEQAMRVLLESGYTFDGRMEIEPEDIHIIQRALESIDD